jgi:hypothetical protein
MWVTSSPSTYRGPLPEEATKGKVAVAVRMEARSVRMLTLAVAVLLARVPANGVLRAVVVVPAWGVALTWRIVPRGMLVAARLTAMGEVVPGGSVMSGGSRKVPLGALGTGWPATLVKARVGGPAGGKTAWG